LRSRSPQAVPTVGTFRRNRAPPRVRTLAVSSVSDDGHRRTGNRPVHAAVPGHRCGLPLPVRATGVARSSGAAAIDRCHCRLPPRWSSAFGRQAATLCLSPETSRAAPIAGIAAPTGGSIRPSEARLPATILERHAPPVAAPPRLRSTCSALDRRSGYLDRARAARAAVGRDGRRPSRRAWSPEGLSASARTRSRAWAGRARLQPRPSPSVAATHPPTPRAPSPAKLPSGSSPCAHPGPDGRSEATALPEYCAPAKTPSRRPAACVRAETSKGPQRRHARRDRPRVRPTGQGPDAAERDR
jgi:hypothetical protein